MSNTKQLSAGKLHYSFGQLNMSDDWSHGGTSEFPTNFLGNLNSTNHRSLTAGQRHSLFLGKIRSRQRKIAVKIQPFYWSILPNKIQTLQTNLLPISPFQPARQRIPHARPRWKHGKRERDVHQLPHLDAVVSGEVEQGVLEHASVAGGEDEAVAVEPVGVLGVVAHDLVVEDVSHGRASHGEPRVAGVGLLHGVDGQEPDRVDRLLEQLAGGGLALERLDGGGAHDALAAGRGRGERAAGRRRGAQAAAGERAEAAEAEALGRGRRRGARARGDGGVRGGDGVRGHGWSALGACACLPGRGGDGEAAVGAEGRGYV